MSATDDAQPLDPRRIRMAGITSIGRGLQRLAAEIEGRCPSEAATLSGTGQAIEAIGEMHDGFPAVDLLVLIDAYGAASENVGESEARCAGDADVARESAILARAALIAAVTP